MSGIDVDDRALRALFQGVLDACDELPAIAARVEAETLGHLILGAQANIYNTTPGAYERTEDYLRSLDAKARATRTGIRVTVSSDSPYASLIEYGRDGVDPTQLQAQAEAQADPSQPFIVGRSGQAWWLPGPVITGAQVFASRLMQDLFSKELQLALRRRS
ncbi:MULTISPECIES: hypothetical protein [unclassified Deinococcus]|uniref:hypothetical protein n=1 Tax=unclassified Deinococcus TaxID=2623546 RepID=UPI0024DEFEAC|nr:hypothetical protein [Deinococcus sp. 43]MDK2013574.1 hypothetical protein [Deinococcus sp. 43]